jgi:hypothetical protein
MGYRQRKVVYRNLGSGKFEDVSEQLGTPVTTSKAGRGAAFADIDNDGDIDIIVNNVNDTPDLFRTKVPPARGWLMIKLVGKQSNRSAIGARVRAVVGDYVQAQEIRGGGSYYSQNDLRAHFGLGDAKRVDRVEVRWPDGMEESWTEVPINRIVTLEQGTGQRPRSR